MHIVEYAVDEEIGLDYPKNGGEFYVVLSSEEKNGMLSTLSKAALKATSRSDRKRLTFSSSKQPGASAKDIVLPQVPAWAHHLTSPSSTRPHWATVPDGPNTTSGSCNEKTRNHVQLTH